MRTVVQRVESAFLDAHGERVGEIGVGLVALAGIEHDDTDDDLAWTARKLVGLRIFEDDAGKMNRSLVDLANADQPAPGLLVVPNFTVAGDASKGRRPTFDTAKPPADASPMFDRFTGLVAAELEGTGVRCITGVFGADMRVGLVNDGPVTLVLRSTR